MSTTHRQHISQLINMTHMTFPTKYLGNPLLLRRPKTADYIFLIDRVQNKLQGWKHNLLSHAGREILIKSTLSTIPSFFMSTVKLPRFVLQKLTSLIRNFWWGYGTSSRHIYFKVWDSFLYPKQFGGLGFKNLLFMNWSLLMKQSWLLISSTSRWWVFCLLKKYGGIQDFWNARVTNSQSFFWQSCLFTRKWLLLGIARVVNNGLQTLVYKHIWIPGH